MTETSKDLLVTIVSGILEMPDDANKWDAACKNLKQRAEDGEQEAHEYVLWIQRFMEIKDEPYYRH